MDLRIDDRTISGVRLVPLHWHGSRPNPKHEAARAVEGLALEDLTGRRFWAYKRGLRSRDRVAPPLGTIVEIGGRRYCHVHDAGLVGAWRDHVLEHVARLFGRAHDTLGRWVC